MSTRDRVKSIDDFEASFFAEARRYLDGAAVDGPAGYPLEQTRRFDARDGRQPLFPFEQHKVIDRWDTWIQNDEGIAKCIDLCEKTMRTSSASGTNKTQSSASEVEARLANEGGGQGDTTPLLGLKLAPPRYKPLSTKLTELYDIVIPD